MSKKATKGIYIAPNHAELIVSGEKTLIIKKKKLPDDRVWWLVTRSKGVGLKLGSISMSPAKPLDLEGFIKLQRSHLITPEERRNWWGDAGKFWCYRFRFKKLKTPIRVDIPRGVQTIVNFIKDINSYDPKKMDSKQLADDWRIVCGFYATFKDPKKEIKYSEKEILQLAQKIHQEMKKRGFKFHPEKMTKTSRGLYERLTSKDHFMDIYPGTESGRGSVIELEDIVNRIDAFKIHEDFVTIVGSLANWRKTTGDIDILIKAPEESDLFELTAWRFKRAFPDLAERFHFIEYGHWAGPFTSHVHVLDLMAVPGNMELHDMQMVKDWKSQCNQSRAEDKVQPMRLFYLLKPMHGRQKEEHYSIDSVLKVLDKSWEGWMKKKVYVEKKHDGVHCSVHKKGRHVEITSEDGNDYTDNCPTLIQEFREQKGDFIVIGEIESWDNGHRPRAVTAGILNSKQLHPEEKSLRINLFDMVYGGN